MLAFINYVNIYGVQVSALVKKNKLYIKNNKTFFCFVLIQDSSQHFSPKEANPNLIFKNQTSGGRS